MPKDCGCDKESPKRNQIWIYEKKCDNKLNIPDNSYLGKIGFTYFLVNKDTRARTEYKVDYKFSNLILGEIVYYVSLYKVTKTKFHKKTNNLKKYLECVSQYSYISKTDQHIITNIINHIGNDNYDLIPDDTNKFNDMVIKHIYKPNSKNGSSNNWAVNINQVGKMYGQQGCYGGICEGNSNCGGGNGECKDCVPNGNPYEFWCAK